MTNRGQKAADCAVDPARHRAPPEVLIGRRVQGKSGLCENRSLSALLMAGARPPICGLRRATLVIRLTRLNHGPFLLNPDLIEHIETTPDTVINLSSGHQYMVLETAEEVAQRILEYRRSICGARCEGKAPIMEPDPDEGWS